MTRPFIVHAAYINAAIKIVPMMLPVWFPGEDTDRGRVGRGIELARYQDEINPDYETSMFECQCPDSVERVVLCKHRVAKVIETVALLLQAGLDVGLPKYALRFKPTNSWLSGFRYDTHHGYGRYHVDLWPERSRAHLFDSVDDVRKFLHTYERHNQHEWEMYPVLSDNPWHPSAFVLSLKG